MIAPATHEFPMPSGSMKSDVGPLGKCEVSWNARLLLSILIGGLALVVYLSTQSFPFFVVDDGDYVFDNPVVQEGLTLRGLWQTTTEVRAANWHPLTWWSLMGDTTLFGRQPASYRITNIAIHALNSVLVFWLMLEIGGSWRRATFIGALFAVHPQHVESVVWITERKDVLSAFFGLIALCLYARSARRQTVVRQLLVAGVLMLGLMAKQMLVTWPILFLLLDFGPLRRGRFANSSREGVPPGESLSMRQAILEKWPFWILSIVFSGAAIIAQQRGGTVGNFESFPVHQRAVTAIVAVAHYVLQSVCPIELSNYYPYPREGFAVSHVLSCAALVALLMVLVFTVRAGRLELIVGCLWFLVTLMPVIGVIQIGEQSMADRYMYLPHIGLFYAFAWWMNDRREGAKSSSIIAVAVVAVFSAITWNQAARWRDSVTLLEHSISVTENGWLFKTPNPQARLLLGLAYWQRAVQSADLNALHSQEDLGKAEKTIQSSLAQRPESSHAWGSLGVVYFSMKDWGEARRCAEKALEFKGDKTSAYHLLGMVAMEAGDLDEAAGWLVRAVKESPLNPQLHVLLAHVLRRVPKGRNIELAERHLRRAIELNSRMAEAYLELARLMIDKDRPDEAVTFALLVIRLDPQNAPAQEILRQWQGGVE